MDNKSGLHSCEASPSSDQRTTLDHTSLTNRIRDNVNWALTFDRRWSPSRPADIWSEIMGLWSAPDAEFVAGVYELLWDRPLDPVGLKTYREVLAAGAPRSALVRVLALSRDDAASPLDVSWLPRLENLEPDAVWTKLRSLWAEPDRRFMAGLFPLLLARPPDWNVVASHCAAMKTGGTRAAVVRAIAMSNEAQVHGLNVSWLTQMEALPNVPTPPPILSLRWLKIAYRQWRYGGKSLSPAGSRGRKGTLQSVKAAAEGERA